MIWYDDNDIEIWKKKAWQEEADKRAAKEILSGIFLAIVMIAMIAVLMNF